jgi:hypothetical protein
VEREHRFVGIDFSPRFAWTALCLAAVAAGCQEPAPEIGGRFSVAYLEGLGGSAGVQAAGAYSDAAGETAFDLGSLKGSRDFYFLLGNTGETAIENIVLTSSNDAFAVTPGEISALEPTADASYDVGLLPVIRVSVNHGTALEGIGFTDLLPPGENSAVITVSGTTVEEDAEIDVGLDIEMTVDAQILDLALYCDDAPVEFGSPSTNWGTNTYGGMGTLPGYFCSGVVEIENTGTVDFTEQGYAIDTYDVVTSQAFSPGDRITVPTDVLPLVIEVDGDNTVSDGDVHTIGNNGKIYFVIFNS